MNKETLRNEMISAMKEKNEVKKNLLKYLISELDRTSKNPSEEDIKKMIKSIVKKAETVNTKESEQEIEILLSYLPTMMTEEEMINLVNHVKSENPDLDGGRLIGLCMREANGLADPQIIKKIILG